MSDFKDKSLKITLITLLIYGGLVATHEGEFWPFSIYPMFSQAGNPWTRAMVTDVTDVPEALLWETTERDHVNGTPLPVRQYGVDQIDFSNFVTKTRNWTPQRKRALITMFDSAALENGRRLMIMKVHGQLTEAGGEGAGAGAGVTIEAVPFLLMTADSVYTNPRLPITAYRHD